MLVLGIHFGHGSAAALVGDGRLLAAIEEEKLNRIKGFVGFPFHSVEYVLKKVGATVEEVDLLALGAEDISEFSYNFVHLVCNIFQSDRVWVRKRSRLLDLIKNRFPGWDTAVFLEKMFFQLLEERLGFPAGRVVKVNHHLAHAASAFYSSPWRETLILTADGKGDRLCGGTYRGNKHGVERLHAVPDRFSVGQIYQGVTRFLGYKVNRHEGKITGLAAYGSPKVTSRLMEAVLGIDGDGRMYNHFYDNARLQRNPVAYYEKEVTDRNYLSPRYIRSLNGDLQQFAVVHQLYQNFFKEKMEDFSPEDMAAGVQQLAEKLLVEYAHQQLQAYLPARVCLAGGVFANVKINQQIREIDGVEGIYVQPAMDDAGCALGAALQATVLRQGIGSVARPALETVYQGPEYTEEEMETALQRSGLPYRRSAAPEEEVARMIHAGRIIGRFTGALEWGPRALGNRSILVHPTDKSINNTLNQRLKRTEFMPFAPSILAENAAEFFVGYREEDLAARYMTVTYDIYPEKVQQIAAAVHIDGTARPQVVHREDNPSFYKIIDAYRRLSGIPAVINTSFNMHEEPIVDTPEDAIRSYQAGAVDMLSMGPFIVGDQG